MKKTKSYSCKESSHSTWLMKTPLFTRLAAYRRTHLLSTITYRWSQQNMRLITSVRLITIVSVYPRTFLLYAANTSKRVSTSGRWSTWRYKKKRSTAWKALYMYVATMCKSIFGLPTLVSSFLFKPMWGMCTICMLFW